jgi:glucose/arabinose dehydrogenase
MRRLVALLLLLLLAPACGGDDGNSGDLDAATDPPADATLSPPDASPPDANPNCSPVSGTPTLGVEDLAGAFAGPVAAVVPPGSGERRIFIVEKSGRKISIYQDGAVLPAPFLDASNVVIVNQPSSERGLLGLAFNADYALNGRFYIYYTSQAVPSAGIGEGDNILAEYRVSDTDPDVADPVGTILLHQPKVATNHNGGWLAIGPDEMLYLSLGEDTTASLGQDTTTLLGKLLRLDVSVAGAYSIPSDNPFAGMGGGVKEEIWAYGLRNPWRASFDRATGDLYIADVGGATREEVNVIPAGAGGGQNFGWVIMEGSLCVGGGACDTTGKTQPIHEYDHNGSNAAITGGYVYRGCDLPDLAGTYFFADSYDRYIRSLRWDGAGGVTDVTEYPELDGHAVFSFGEDAEGELLLLDGSDGHMYRIIPAP